MGICFGSFGKAHAPSATPAQAPRVVTSLASHAAMDAGSSSKSCGFECSADSAPPKEFKLSVLRAATNNFHSNNFLGERRFGEVFKGWVDEMALRAAKPGKGTAVAVKVLKEQTPEGYKEYNDELKFSSHIHHENLVRLIGHCDEKGSAILVYEYLQRGSLDNHLFKRTGEALSWNIRMGVAIDVARGMAFMHNYDANLIFHDLKSANIFLDSDFKAKIANYGIEKESPSDGNARVRTRAGESYAAPEYVISGSLTPGCDVYSYGVVLLELLSGKKTLHDNYSGYSLVDWAQPLLAENMNNVVYIFDGRLQDNYDKKGALAMGALALDCVNQNPKCRPTMSEAVNRLVSVL